MVIGGNNVEVQFLFGIPTVELPSYRKAEPVGNKEVEVHKGINFELLDEIMDFIRKNPQTWYQDNWYRVCTPTGDAPEFVMSREEMTEVNSCETSFCFAGHVALSQGFPYPPLENSQDWERDVLYKGTDGEEYEYTESVSDFAEKVLGLRGGQASLLFGGQNRIEDLEAIIEIFRREPNIRSWWVDDALTQARFDEQAPDVDAIVSDYRDSIYWKRDQEEEY